MEWLALVERLFGPLLLKCFEKTSAEDPQDFLRSQYNAHTGTMDRDVVQDSIPQMRRALRRARRDADRDERRNFPRLSKSELYDLTEQELIKAMNAPPETVASARAVASGLPDEDDE